MSRVARARRPLDSSLIAKAALALIDAEGLDELSMRTLAKRLGVEAMSLYHHVPSKDTLLDLVMELLAGEIVMPEQGSWEERIRESIRAHRRVALAHPRAYILMLTRPYQTPALLAYCERIVAMVAALGMDPERTAKAFRFVGHFVDGAMLYASAGPARKQGPPVPAAPPLDPAVYPQLSRVGPHLSRTKAEQHFEFGLERMIDELRRMAKEPKV
jgi:AcrR family transcriptional regulator